MTRPAEGLARTLPLGLAISVVACGASRHAESAPATPAPVPIQSPQAYSSEEIGAKPVEEDRSIREQVYAASEIQLTGPLAAAPAVRRARESLLGALVGSSAPQSPTPTAPAPLPAGQRPSTAVSFFDVEAHVSVEVKHVADATARLKQLLRSSGGELVNEAIEDGPSVSGASLSLRVPSDRVYPFLDGLGALGRVRSRKVETTELGRKERDAEVLLRELQATLARYEQLLSHAANVSDMTEIEAKLSDTRTAIDRVASDITWMKDRVARSTVYVTLYTKAADAGLEPAEAKLHPGLHLGVLVDAPPRGDASSFVGTGLSLWFVRAFSVDLDLFTGLGSRYPGTHVDHLLATVGGEIYSDQLGGGRRRFLNPYLGLRGGYAHAGGHSALALGGALGVELFRSEAVLLDLQSRFYALVGPHEGTHFAVQPFVAVNVAY